MVQVLATTFFSAAALAALGIIVAMIVDNFGDVRQALRLVPAHAPLPPVRVRVRVRIEQPRAAATASSGSPLRAAA